MFTTNTYKVSPHILGCLKPPLTFRHRVFYLDMHDKNWAWTNYISLRALQQAENVRAQLQRTMERFEVEVISLQDEQKLFVKIRQALVCGFFMQVAHKEGEKGNYLTVKDHQVNFRFLMGQNDCYVPDDHDATIGRRSAPILWLGYPARMGHFQRVCFDHSSVHSNGV